MARLDVIQNEQELDEILGTSREHPLFLLKHSLTCPVSNRAHGQFERFLRENSIASKARFALLEIQKHRALSDRIAEMTGIRHESPQALLFRDNEVLWSASHFAITCESLRDALAGLD